MNDAQYSAILRELRHHVLGLEAQRIGWMASRFLGTQEIFVYIVGQRYPNDLWTAQTNSEKNRRWAMIFDPNQGFWEMWVDGHCIGPFEEHELDGVMLFELRKNGAIPDWRQACRDVDGLNSH